MIQTNSGSENVIESSNEGNGMHDCLPLTPSKRAKVSISFDSQSLSDSVCTQFFDPFFLRDLNEFLDHKRVIIAAIIIISCPVNWFFTACLSLCVHLVINALAPSLCLCLCLCLWRHEIHSVVHTMIYRTISFLLPFESYRVIQRERMFYDMMDEGWSTSLPVCV